MEGQPEKYSEHHSPGFCKMTEIFKGQVRATEYGDGEIISDDALGGVGFVLRQNEQEMADAYHHARELVMNEYEALDQDGEGKDGEKMLEEGTSSAELEQLFGAPAFFPPEVTKVAAEWWEHAAHRINLYTNGRGLAPFNELEELLQPRGITDPNFIAELIITVSSKVRENQRR